MSIGIHSRDKKNRLAYIFYEKVSVSVLIRQPVCRDMDRKYYYDHVFGRRFLFPIRRLTSYIIAVAAGKVSDFDICLCDGSRHFKRFCCCLHIWLVQRNSMCIRVLDSNSQLSLMESGQ